MQISDLNRLEKYLSKFKYYVNAGYEPTPEEVIAIQTIEAQLVQIEETLFNLRIAKGSVAGLLVRSLKDACPENMNSTSITANEKGFSLSIPLVSIVHYNQNRNSYEQVTRWAHNLSAACQRHFMRQEVAENEIQILLQLNQINPKLKMYNVRYTGHLEFHFEISKKAAQNEADRENIAREVMQTIYIFIQQKKNELGLHEVALAQE